MLFKKILFPLFIFPLAFAQNIDSNCPPLYTHTQFRVPKIEIGKIEVVDSYKYSFIPRLIGISDSLSELFVYPEIAKKAGVEGDVILFVTVDENGNIRSRDLIRGIGAGCDEAAKLIVSELKFFPAKIDTERVASQLTIWVNFKLTSTIDKPDYLFDEIIYEKKGLGYYKKLSLKKFNTAGLSEIVHQKIQKNKEGEIPPGLYTRLSDFIISQRFLSYEDSYMTVTFDHATEITITVKTNSIEKAVWTYGLDGDPVGLWAIINLIPYVENQIKWVDVIK
jgi:TonB family protein